MSENPYQAPSVLTEAPPTAKLTEKPTLARIFLRWLGVCSAAAAPSFVLGIIMDGYQVPAILGMICAVFLFVLGYTYLEQTPVVQAQLEDWVMRRTFKIGYGTRIAISILFPVGFYLDMIVGIFSVPMGMYLLQFTVGDPGDQMSLNQPGFLTHFVLTVTQGICLNIVLTGYMFIVWAIIKTAQMMTRKTV